VTEVRQRRRRPSQEPAAGQLGERVRNLRAQRGLTRKTLANRRPTCRSGTWPTWNTAPAMPRSWCCSRWPSALQCSLAELVGDVTTSSPEWLLIRELLERRSEADLRRVRVALGELLGTGGRPGRQAPGASP
jgi:XRE family aerobic/anaerobic benzoate catabolism transcriptional regulator